MLVVPRGNYRYKAKTCWQGVEYAFTVRLSMALARALRRQGALLDLCRGQLRLQKGAVDIFGHARGFEQKTGLAAPAWLLRLPSALRPYAIPLSELRLDWDATLGKLIFVTPRRCLPVFGCLRRPRRRVTAASVLAPATLWDPRHYPIIEGIDVVSCRRSSAMLARVAFFSVCGRAACRWRAQMGEGRHRWNDPREYDRRSLPVALVVVPSALHFSALPPVRPLRNRLLCRAAGSRMGAVRFDVVAPWEAATVVSDGKRLLFLPEDDLFGWQVMTRHELYHLLEEQLLDAGQRQQIECFYRAVVERAGPFVRPYGYLRQEFFATMGEAYEGAYGEEGRRWLCKHHGELFAFMNAYVGAPLA